MAMYKFGVSDLYQQPFPAIGHWYLRKDQEWMIEMTDDEVAMVVERIMEIVGNIEAGKFTATPGYFQCQYCDYQELCDAYGNM